MWARMFGPLAPNRLSVPAGSFSALKIIAQVDIATVMPNWPRFVMHVIEPVVPENTLYFQATPPYRLLKQQGATFVGGPEVTTELIRFYIAGAPPTSFPSAAGSVPGVPVAAAARGSRQSSIVGIVAPGGDDDAIFVRTFLPLDFTQVRRRFSWR